jgi:hypothetical protein
MADGRTVLSTDKGAFSGSLNTVHERSNGSLYYIYRNIGLSTTTLYAWRTTDITANWSRLTANSWVPTNATSLWAISSIQIGDVIHLAVLYSDTGDVLTVGYNTYNMATESFGTQETVTTLGTDTIWSGEQFHIGIEARGDGDIIIGYPGAPERVMGDYKARADYARREGGTWTADIGLDGGGDVHHWVMLPVYSGDFETIHFGGANDQSTGDMAVQTLGYNRFQAITLSNDNTLGTLFLSDELAPQDDDKQHPIQRGSVDTTGRTVVWHARDVNAGGAGIHYWGRFVASYNTSGVITSIAVNQGSNETYNTGVSNGFANLVSTYRADVNVSKYSTYDAVFTGLDSGDVLRLGRYDHTGGSNIVWGPIEPGVSVTGTVDQLQHSITVIERTNGNVTLMIVAEGDFDAETDSTAFIYYDLFVGGPLTASGTPNVTGPTASGVANHELDAAGTPTVTGPTASGAAKLKKVASGAATLVAVTAVGAATLVGAALTASGSPNVTGPTASGQAGMLLEARGGGSTPTVVTRDYQAFPTAASSHSVSITGYTQGNLGIIGIVTNNDLGGGSSFTVPTGWTAIDNAPVSGANQGLRAIFVKVLGASETDPVVCAINPAANQEAEAIFIEVSDWEGTLSGVEVANRDFSTSNLSSTETPPQLTVSWGAENNLWIIGVLAMDDLSSVTTWPTGYTTNGSSENNGAGIDVSAMIGTSYRAAAVATETPGLITLSESESVHGFTIGVRPAAATQVPTVTASGAATLGALTASGNPDVSGPTASGAATLTALEASGSPDVTGPTASGQAGMLLQASGTPNVTGPAASGAATKVGALTASGSPDVTGPTASGAATLTALEASGSPNVTGPTASGAATLAGSLTASGSPNVTGPTASGTATLTALEASGSPNVTGPTASGAASLKKAASGTPTVTGPTASGSAGMLLSASGTPSVTGPTASGTVAKIIRASGTPNVTGPTSFGLVSLGAAQALGSPNVTGPTASGTVTKIIRASGTPTLEAVTAAGQAGMLRQASGSPSVEQVTASGAAAKTITASGTPNVTGPTASGQAGMLLQASGSPSVAQVTASGAAVLAGALQASGSPNVEQVTASGTVTLAALQAAGSPTVTEATASGSASLKKVASGTPTLDQVTASGAATLAALEASGSPNIDPVTSFGLATLGGLQALGSPNVEQVTASGTVTKKIAASGSPVVSQVTASGAAAAITTVKQGSGSPVVQAVTAAGSASLRKVASGTPTIDPVTASGTVSLRKQASGSPVLEATSASGSATTAASDRRGIYSALGQFPTGSSVTITLYDPITLAPISLTDNVCEEIGTTGCYVWHSGKLTTQPVGYKEYVWVMTDTLTETCDIIRVNVMGVDDLFNYVVENDETFAMQLRLIRANAAGRIIEQSDGSYVIRDAVDSKDRIVGDDAVNGGRDILNTDGT